MKVKLNLSVDGIKSLLIQHGEKAAFAIAGLLLLLYVSSAMQTEVLGPERSASKLSDQANVARQHILDSTWDPKEKQIEVVDYPARAKPARLNDADYHLAVYFNKPIWETKSKRPEPKLLPVEELLAVGGRGVIYLQSDEDAEDGGPIGGGTRDFMRRPPAFRGKNPMIPPIEPPTGRGGKERGGRVKDRHRDEGPKAKDKDEEDENVRPLTGSARSAGIESKGVRVSSTNANLKGYSWVVVTGLVPEKKQEDEFDEAFRNVIYQDAKTDQLEYYWQQVERCEIGADGKPTAWHELDADELERFVARQEGAADEVVDEEYLSKLYTCPLAPLVGEDWTFEMGGHPKVGRAPERNAFGQFVDGGARKDREAKGEVPPGEEEEKQHGFRGAQGRVGGGLGRGVRGGPMGGMPGDRMPRISGRGELGMRGQPRGPGMSEMGTSQPDNTLYRFIDYTVQPGKKYQYRVKLSLYNPNYKLQSRYLKNPESAKPEYIVTDWSEPTPVVVVPYDETVVVGPIATKSLPREPQAQVAVVKIDREKGLRPAAIEDVSRGTVANFKKPEVWVADAGRMNELKYKDVDFQSNILVVDIQGGDRLDQKNKTLTSPVDLLVLQPDGSLRVHDELAEMEDFELYKPEDEEDSRKRKDSEDLLRGDGRSIPGDPYGGGGRQRRKQDGGAASPPRGAPDGTPTRRQRNN